MVLEQFYFIGFLVKEVEGLGKGFCRNDVANGIGVRCKKSSFFPEDCEANPGGCRLQLIVTDEFQDLFLEKFRRKMLRNLHSQDPDGSHEPEIVILPKNDLPIDDPYGLDNSVAVSKSPVLEGEGCSLWSM